MIAQHVELALADERATEVLGRRLGSNASPPLVIALAGPLGAGKTTLARGFIRAAAGGEIDVPSPTFTLVQTYELGRATIWHFDLYRLRHPDEVWELGFEEALEDGIVLIEWPERLEGALPSGSVSVVLTQNGTGRMARLSAPEPHPLLSAILP